VARITVYIRTIDAYGRGVGVLEDGTVVVVEDAEVGETVEAEVQYEMRTPTGKVLFAKRVA
jgi:uncharacterized protein YacL